MTSSNTKENAGLDLSFVRDHFPALDKAYTFMDNAGGSQTLGLVIKNITEYLTHHDVQLGASYEISARAGKKLQTVTQELAQLVNAARPEEVVIGPSSTMLFRILSICLSEGWQAGDEVVVTNSDHEANVSCWMDLQAKGIVVKIWKVNPETLQFDLTDLKNLLTEKTKLVAMVHASNILGTINPIQQISKVVHEAGALFCVDGVAFAPHRLVDVQAFDVDFYVFSWYKVYGPHLALMFGKYDLLKNMPGINHYFIDQIPYKFQPGNFNYELTYSLKGVCDYLTDLHDHQFPDAAKITTKEKYQKSFELIAQHEEKLASILLDYLKTKENISIIGQSTADKNSRVPTIAFVHKDLKSSAIVEKVDPHKMGIRFGDFYAKKLIADLGLEEKDGVVRVSLVHYNTEEEVRRLVEVFEDIL